MSPQVVVMEVVPQSGPSAVPMPVMAVSARPVPSTFVVLVAVPFPAPAPPPRVPPGSRGGAAAVLISPRAAGHKSCASCSSLMASAPVPSWAMVMLLGCSWSNGVSGCAVVTPEAIGYSKLSLWAMIC